MRRITPQPWSLLLLLCALSAPSALAQESIEIPLGFSHLVAAERAMESVFIGNPEIVDVEVVSDDTIVLTANGVGQTNLILTDENGEEVLSAVLNVTLQSPQRARVRVIEGGADRDGVLYACGPAPGCTALNEGEPDPTESTLIEGAVQPGQQTGPTAEIPPLPADITGEDAE